MASVQEARDATWRAFLAAPPPSTFSIANPVDARRDRAHPEGRSHSNSQAEAAGLSFQNASANGGSNAGCVRGFRVRPIAASQSPGLPSRAALYRCCFVPSGCGGCARLPIEHGKVNRYGEFRIRKAAIVSAGSVQ